MYDLAKMLCSFINWDMAKHAFTKPESVENTGFLEDLQKLDPSFDMSKYEELLEESKRDG